MDWKIKRKIGQKLGNRKEEEVVQEERKKELETGILGVSKHIKMPIFLKDIQKN